jgi:hypothetical protein
MKILKVKDLDKSPPVIKIIKPDLARGFKLTVKEESVEIEGIATDESGIFDVIVNGISADLSNDGRFTAKYHTCRRCEPDSCGCQG